MHKNPRLRRTLAGLATAAALLGAASGAAPAHRLPAPEYLPPEARALLDQRMARHRESASELLDSALLLDFEGAHRAAGAILAEPRLSRPEPAGADLLNARLPARFFDLQDQLAERAGEVQRAAAARDPARLSEATGWLAQTCTACHAAYLAPPATR